MDRGAHIHVLQRRVEHESVDLGSLARHASEYIQLEIQMSRERIRNSSHLSSAQTILAEERALLHSLLVNLPDALLQEHLVEIFRGTAKLRGRNVMPMEVIYDIRDAVQEGCLPDDRAATIGQAVSEIADFAASKVVDQLQHQHPLLSRSECCAIFDVLTWHLREQLKARLSSADTTPRSS